MLTIIKATAPHPERDTPKEYLLAQSVLLGIALGRLSDLPTYSQDASIKTVVCSFDLLIFDTEHQLHPVEQLEVAHIFLV